MKILRLILFVALSVTVGGMHAQRMEQSLDGIWKFRFSHQVEQNTEVDVTLPHTWNAQDALSGKLDYKRGIGNYRKALFVPKDWKGKRLFLRFKGAYSVTDAFMNGKFIGEHRGGYSAFIFEITNNVRYGEQNQLLVRVNNAEQLDVMPLVGDFNFYGGLYRGVSLLVTDEACISPLDYASPGVYLTQKKISHELAEVEALIKLSNKGGQKALKLCIEVLDGTKAVCKKQMQVRVDADQATQVTLPFTINRPHLWNGKADPFMYKAVMTLYDNGKAVDQVVQPLGLRSYHVDAEKGFYLNGNHLTLQGVCRHQDRPEIGNALQSLHHQEDVDLMLEMGVNAVRLAHYQQAEELYTLMDQYGIITWAEIPFVGPGGYLDKGFVDSESFKENGKQQLKELIRQNYNHPSICFWGIFNEIKEEGDNPLAYVRELNELVHAEDKTRLSTAASNQQGNLNFVTDLIAWNRYDGWYGKSPESLLRFLDQTHREHPDLCIGISEYGAGASIYHQMDSLVQPHPSGYWHPENWQTHYHIKNWQIIHDRPFVWGSFVWNMFDFGAAHRHEGDRKGINDKGLVTFDRKIKKDAFFFYKANWNKEKMIHIAGGRCKTIKSDKMNLLIFANCGEVELFVNGKRIGSMSPDDYATIDWRDIQLTKGINTIVVQSVSYPQLKDKRIVECLD